MSIYRKDYKKSIKEEDCLFCGYLSRGEIVRAYEHFFVMQNHFPYPSKDHIMLIPKRHVHSTTEFTTEELAEMCTLDQMIVSEFKRVHGMCFMLRREDTPHQSIYHQHTHYMSDDSFISPIDRMELQPLQIKL